MNSMLLRAALVSVALIPVFASAQDVTGAGASFPAPIYSKWADAYNKATGEFLAQAPSTHEVMQLASKRFPGQRFWHAELEQDDQTA